VSDSPEPIAAALAAFDAAPLSRKRAMLVVLLLDAEIDRLCLARGEPDLLAARADLAAAHPALGVLMALAAMRDDGPRLVLDQTVVPPTDYPTLGEADYMVSLYNDATVPRVRVLKLDGSATDARDLLHEAHAAFILEVG